MLRWLSSALLLSGCGVQLAAVLSDERDVTIQQQEGTELVVLETLPPDGVSGVAHRSSPYYLFNRPMTEAERGTLGNLTMAQTDGGGSFTFAPQVAFDGAAVQYGQDRLNRPEGYTIDVQLPGGAAHSTFATDELSGPDFNLAAGLEVVAFGADAEDAATLGSLFTPEAPVWLAKALGLAGALPATVDLALAVASARPDASVPFYIHRAYGYVTRFDGVQVAADGSFEATRASALLPLWISDEPLLLWLRPMTVRGVLAADGSGLGGFELQGVVDTRTLLEMAQLPDPWPRLLDVLTLDVDANGNGVMDSATIHLRSEPTLVPRDQIDFG